MTPEIWTTFIGLVHNVRTKKTTIEKIDEYLRKHEQVFREFVRRPATRDNLILIGFLELWTSDNVVYYTPSLFTSGALVTRDGKCEVHEVTVHNRLTTTAPRQYLNNMWEVLEYSRINGFIRLALMN
ncbi:MAG: hypothetical protein JNJ75_10500 [Cyclobacteriaceae bacterium]|nr:hypothetical protein [Cyclobacteriaceae bacterium]